ncbi:MAG TPA: DUF1015 domain-containing protein [Thermoleophilia bacterium]|nr:DUF1015 domain-containing protein [Thermoleophilia bacterium]
MADVHTFRGLRYRDDVRLDDVVAPPYDVLSAAQAAELRARSPYNAIHVDLPVPPGAPADEEAYLRAASTFLAWREEGVLVRDELPGIVVVDQTYTGPDGRERTRSGFVARLRLAALDERVVLPHERTHAGPKVDRLRLYRATHADLSTIFLLFPDDDGSVGKTLEAAAAELPAAAWREAHDGDGNTHRCAAVAGPAAERVAGALAGRPVYIADGHHRYETALAYRDERRAAGDPSADTLMVYLCSLSDPGLTVFPTHRLVHSIPQLSTARLRELVAPCFDVLGEPVTGVQSARTALEALPDQTDPAGVFGLYLPREEACLTVRAREPEASRRLAAGGFSPAAAGLSVTLLHELLLSDALGLGHDDAERHVDYAKSVPDALAELAGGKYELGAFLNATRVDQVRAIADEGEVMPQKSTYFYPKLLTGLVYDALGD